MTDILVWGYKVPRAWVSQGEADYLNGLPHSLPTIDWVWFEMDRVWLYYGLDNRRSLADQPAIADFYRHPVWLMNGIFSQTDPVSVGHRVSIAKYLKQNGINDIADYGGGFGGLALGITRAMPAARISIVEPFPSNVGLERLKGESNVRFVPELGSARYDAIVAQDVLEHVEDPVLLSWQIASAMRQEGIVIFANCFYPVIKCHLPTTFHLRLTFRLVMLALGLKYVGSVEGAKHAQVFKFIGQPNLARARRAERVSRLLGPTLNLAFDMLSKAKRLVMR